MPRSTDPALAATAFSERVRVGSVTPQRAAGTTPIKEMTDSNETVEESTAETARRTFLKGTAAARTAVAGLSALTGSAAAQQGGGGNLLKNLDVTGELSDGGTFDGKISITDFAFDDGEFLTSGTIKGTVETADGVTEQINQTFEDVVTSLDTKGNSGKCDVLFLNLGPLDLNLLGLQVDLSEITLNIDAARGPGNLLGNLLCAVANLLSQ